MKGNEGCSHTVLGIKGKEGALPSIRKNSRRTLLQGKEGSWLVAKGTAKRESCREKNMQHSRQ